MVFKNLHNGIIEPSYVLLDFITSPIVYIIERLNKFIVLEQNGVAHLIYEYLNNSNTMLADIKIKIPLMQDNKIILMTESVIIDKLSFFCVFENGVICIINHNKVLFGMYDESKMTFKKKYNITNIACYMYIVNVYNNVLYADIFKSNPCDYFDIEHITIKTFDLYFLEKLMLLALSNKITVFIVSSIMVLLFGQEKLQLINILQDYLLKSY